MSLDSWVRSLNRRAAKTASRAAGALQDNIFSGARPPPSDEVSALVAAIDRALSVHVIHSNVSKAVDRYFSSLVDAIRDNDGHKNLTFDQVISLSTQLAGELGLPAALFSGLEVELESFDFNGDGLLDATETKRLFKKVLQQQRLRIGGRKPVEVPSKSMEEAGFTVVKELGRGGQGAMYLCTKSSWFTTKRYCIKFYSKEDANAGGLSELIDEYELMISLDHDHIAKTFDVFQDDKFYYLVNEPYFGGDFTKLGKKAYDEGVRMSEAWWRAIFRQCLDGLSYLHSRGIMHCDIKEPNIMVASGDSYKSPRPVLIDFGLSANFLGGSRGVCGTPGYIPPETWQSGTWFPRGDTFSMGITFFQLMTGRVPSKNGTIRGVLQIVQNGDFASAAWRSPLPWDQFPSSMPALRQLLDAMTVRDRASRPKPNQVLQDPWFSASSDAELPRSSLKGLVGAAALQGAHEELQQQLTGANKLADLHTMVDKFKQADPTGTGVVDARVAAQVLTEHGASADVVRSCAPTVGGGGGGGTFGYAALAAEAISSKEQYDYHFVKDLFDKLDTDRSGTLSLEELRALLCSKAFDVPPEHVSEVLAWMDVNGDGVVCFDEFARAALEYGRIANRSEVDPAFIGNAGILGKLAAWGGAWGAAPAALPASARTAHPAAPLVSAPPASAFGPVDDVHGGGGCGPDAFAAASMAGRGKPPPPSCSSRSSSCSSYSSGGGDHWTAAVRTGGRSRGSRRRKQALHGGNARPPRRARERRKPRRVDFPRQPTRLHVAVLSARGLRAGIEGLLAECHPFVTCGVSSAPHSAFQTQVVRHSGDPTWNVEQEILDYMPGDSVDFAVLSSTHPFVEGPHPHACGPMEDVLIGTASLCCDRFFPHGFDGDLTIMGPAGTGIRGLMRVRVSLPDIAPASTLTGHHDAGAFAGAAMSARGPTVTWGRCWTEERAPVVRSTHELWGSPHPVYGQGPMHGEGLASYQATAPIAAWPQFSPSPTALYYGGPAQAAGAITTGWTGASAAVQPPSLVGGGWSAGYCAGYQPSAAAAAGVSVTAAVRGPWPHQPHLPHGTLLVGG